MTTRRWPRSPIPESPRGFLAILSDIDDRRELYVSGGMEVGKTAVFCDSESTVGSLKGALRDAGRNERVSMTTWSGRPSRAPMMTAAGKGKVFLLSDTPDTEES